MFANLYSTDGNSCDYQKEKNVFDALSNAYLTVDFMTHDDRPHK